MGFVFALACLLLLLDRTNSLDECHFEDTAECDRQQLCNGKLCASICRAGTVRVDEWANYALRTQRSLTMDLPLYRTFFPGTHNSAISQAYSIGIEGNGLGDFIKPEYAAKNECLVLIADQPYSMTDQLNMGIRALEIDVNYGDGDGLNGNEKEGGDGKYVRVCHFIDTFPPVPEFLAMLTYVGVKHHQKLEWDPTRIGCNRHSPAARTLLLEIKDWLLLPAHQDEIVQIYIDNRVLEKSHIQIVADLVKEVFADSHLLFTPVLWDQLYRRQWPSYRELLRIGKRVIAVNFNEFHLFNISTGADIWWSPPFWFSTQFDLRPAQWDPLKCTAKGISWYGRTFSRGLDNRLILGPHSIYDETQQGKLIVTDDDIKRMLDCGAGQIALAELAPNRTKAFVWSWDYGSLQPQSTSPGLNCVYMGTNGRWFTADCEIKLRVACLSNSASSSSTAWVVTNSSARFSDAPTACASLTSSSSFHFAVPLDSKMNHDLLQLADVPRGAVWVNFQA
eukprot:TRINITY_DN8792_c0_g1_i1.p1 TRINITY_DN8792_c0_g1~~TRINITY_DN8792_c0_g1_i1.p1  ORF type:complete len:506 (+),score=74.26 TRINITY_DN8792_c0_g1_i1:45-1562(+)